MDTSTGTISLVLPHSPTRPLLAPDRQCQTLARSHCHRVRAHSAAHRAQLAQRQHHRTRLRRKLVELCHPHLCPQPSLESDRIWVDQGETTTRIRRPRDHPLCTRKADSDDDGDDACYVARPPTAFLFPAHKSAALHRIRLLSSRAGLRVGHTQQGGLRTTQVQAPAQHSQRRAHRGVPQVASLHDSPLLSPRRLRQQNSLARPISPPLTPIRIPSRTSASSPLPRPLRDAPPQRALLSSLSSWPCTPRREAPLRCCPLCPRL